MVTPIRKMVVDFAAKILYIHLSLCLFAQGSVPSPLRYKEQLLSELRKLDRRGCQSADVFQ